MVEQYADEFTGSVSRTAYYADMYHLFSSLWLA
jgi:hypothetical protein